MTQKEKQLLLQDLSARLPYGVKVTTTNAAVEFGVISGISVENKISVSTKRADIVFNCTEVKPYLFPLSSMTEEQTEELVKLINTGQNDNNEFMRSLCRIEFYHKYHFDYRGLIPMGLAIDCSNLNIY